MKFRITKTLTKKILLRIETLKNISMLSCIKVRKKET